MGRPKPRPGGRRRDASTVKGGPAAEVRDLPPARRREATVRTTLNLSTSAFRILVVDDEPAVAHTLRDYLADDGYDVEVALSGADAVESIARQRADLVLLDIMMPGMSGVEVLRRIKAIDSSIPVVMATANADEGLARSTLEMGAFDYLMKPFEFARLSEVVMAALVCGADGGDVRRLG